MFSSRIVLAKWKRATIVSGIVLALGVGSSIPFMAGHSYHAYFRSVGRWIIYACMWLWLIFVLCAAQTYNYWKYRRDFRKSLDATHQE